MSNRKPAVKAKKTSKKRNYLTLEDIKTAQKENWEWLEEYKRANRKSMEEFDRKMDRQAEESKRQDEEIRSLKKETDRRMGYLDNRFGEMVEHLVLPSIQEKFTDLGFFFEKCSENVRIKDHKNSKVYAELDLFLENGDVAICVEVKVKPDVSDIKAQIKRMEILRDYANRKNDKRNYQAAIAAAILTKPVREHALKNGLYVICQSGDTMRIEIPEGFVPRNWQSSRL